MLNNDDLILSLLALAITILSISSSWFKTATSQEQTKTNSSIMIDDKIRTVIGNTIAKMMNDTVSVMKNNTNYTAIDNQTGTKRAVNQDATNVSNSTKMSPTSATDNKTLVTTIDNVTSKNNRENLFSQISRAIKNFFGFG
jgi:hypothetical protein